MHGLRWAMAAIFVVLIVVGVWLVVHDPLAIINEGRRRSMPRWVMGLLITPCAMCALWCFLQQLRFERSSK